MRKSRIRISVAAKTVLFSLILVTVSTETIANLVYKDSAVSLESQLGIKLLRIANSAAPLIPGDHSEFLASMSHEIRTPIQWSW